MINREKLLNKISSYNNKELAIFMYHHNISTCDENDTENWNEDDYAQWLSQEAVESLCDSCINGCKDDSMFVDSCSSYIAES